MTRKNFTLSITDKANTALEEIIKHSEFADLNPSRNFMLSYVITTYRKMQKEVEDANAKADRAIQTALAAGRGVKYKEPTLSYAEKRAQVEQEKRERALEICEALGGRVEGDVCYYKKYEITAAGLVVETSVSNNLDSLTDKMVDEQYYPSKEEWLAAKAIEDAKT